MEERHRKPGSVRLSDEQYEEMERLGIDSESAYVKYKLNGAQQHLQVLRNEDQTQLPAPMATEQMPFQSFEDKLALQKLSIENEQLKNKLEEMSTSKEETLSGIHDQVSGMLRDELLKRDFEDLKKEVIANEKEINKLERELEKATAQIEDKESEIEELVKKLGLVELGKALLPGAVSGLAKKYPKEMQGLAATLGELSGEEPGQLPAAGQLSEEQQNLLNIAEYFRELFDDEQFEQIIQMISQLGEQIQQDDTVIGKVIYYLNQLSKVKNAQQKQAAKEQEQNQEA
ncbi:hypothetical protein FNH22_19950 [Fulvivirga sp. M361]|uniref:hypothetical protein n=1 Tax=Fulvivirga sp. M361 TaxID=2594266 RepID=UPI00117A9471|nr:hypothetical protein [Fulvivirga sp. M361]TRX54387.1 hypothetical protein FNH22_19950 [Fulvivirga sp. M361]